MNASQAYHKLINLLLIRDFVREHTAPRPRLPLGRCACHEPTVKWCGRHGKPPGQHVLRPVIEVDARRRHQPGQPPVIPADLMVRRGQRNLDRLDAEVAERAGLVGEHDVIVPTRPDERGDELAGVRRRATHDADQRSDPDAHPHLVARGAPTGVARRPVAARSPATAPCPSARTISRSPRSAWSAALAATIAP